MVEFRRLRLLPTVWAVMLGLIVTTAGSLPWSALVVLNVKFGVLFPWASVVMALYLVVYLKYLNGWGPPPSTAAIRASRLRARSLPGAVWGWALLAGGSANIALAAVFVVISRLGWIHHAKTPLPALPPLTIAVWLLTGAAVSGIAEECGFRGYMQGILEERYRAPIAIVITSVCFGAFHLTHGFSPAIIFDAAWGAVYGVLILSGSILPSMVLHASLDALEVLVLWKFSGISMQPPVTFDSAATVTLFSGMILAVVAYESFRRLSQVRVSERTRKVRPGEATSI